MSGLDSKLDCRDPAQLLCALVKCESITPEDGGAQALLMEWLNSLGFEIEHAPFGDNPKITNFHAFRAVKGETFSVCFAGHTDVVAPGDGWSRPPFLGEIVTTDHEKSYVFGRGTQDMKGGLAACVAAVARCLERQPNLPIRLGFLVTGDEEGPAIHGTKPLVKAVVKAGHNYNACLLSEPTSQTVFGDMIKIGRRGSLSGTLRVSGQQGHVAYPDKADNPLPRLLALLTALNTLKLDEGTEEFQPSNLEIIGLDAPMIAWNVTPATASAQFNVRFNTLHTAESLTEKIKSCLRETGIPFELETRSSGEAFITKKAGFVDHLQTAIISKTGIKPELSTSGGTSDARFIQHYWPVAEFGLVGDRMHQTDECTPVADLESLTACIEGFLDAYSV